MPYELYQPIDVIELMTSPCNCRDSLLTRRHIYMHINKHNTRPRPFLRVFCVTRSRHVCFSQRCYHLLPPPSTKSTPPVAARLCLNPSNATFFVSVLLFSDI